MSGERGRTARAARPFAVIVTMLALLATGALAWAGPAAAATPISGKVTNQSAQPLEGIEVCAVVLAPYREICASTDASGEYLIPGTGPGYEVRFSDPDGVAPGHAPQWYPGKPHAEEGEAVSQAEIEAGVDAVMTPGVEVGGTILAATLAGAPVAGVNVFLDPTTVPLGEVAPHDTTGADGRFALSDLGPGTFHLVFEPEEGVNFQERTFTTPPLGPGSGIEAEVPLKRGVEFEGTLTDGTTGLPVEPFGGPGRTPTACALEGLTEVVIKCVPVGVGGKYAIAGLPSGGYVLAFGADTKEDGLDLDPDGYVRQYYDDKSNSEDALMFLIEEGAVETGLDATLVRGEEIWPEEASTGETPASGSDDEEVDGGDGATNGGGTSEHFSSAPVQSGTVPPPIPALLFPASHRTVLPKYTCRKGFHRVAKGGSSRCVKIRPKPKRHRPRKHHKKAEHR